MSGYRCVIEVHRYQFSKLSSEGILVFFCSWIIWENSQTNPLIESLLGGLDLQVDHRNSSSCEDSRLKCWLLLKGERLWLLVWCLVVLL